MKKQSILRTLAVLLVAVLPVKATDRFYNDIEVKSHSGDYVVKAISPDNKKKKGRKVFQSSFSYTLTNTKTKKILWTRHQKMGKPEKDGEDPSYDYIPQEEGSPVRLFISDSGYTVIYTSWNELILIDLKGKQTGMISVLKDGFTKKENNDYVHDTTAGPMWGGRSHWYFMEVDSEEYFVIRPWWGRQVIVKLSNGKITSASKTLKTAMFLAEKAFVIKVLNGVNKGVEQRCDCCGGPHQANLAVYLAGKLKVIESIPALRKLEADTSIGSTTMGGFEEIPQGRVDPFNYANYTTRQNAQLALRRMGAKPAALPCTRFKKSHKDFDKEKPYLRKAVKGSRHTNASKLKKGMSPEQVIDLLDCPDYIPSRTWQYDIDAEVPYTLSVSWTDDRKVEKISKTMPALWQKGTVRDDGL